MMINVHKGDTITRINSSKDINLAQLLIENSFGIKTPCGGNGTCGKCRIKVSGELDAPTYQEEKLLGKNAVEKGYRLACYLQADKDIDIYMEDDNSEAKIITAGNFSTTELCPQINKEIINLEVELDSLNRAKTSWVKSDYYSLEILREISKVLSFDNQCVTLTYYGKRLIDIENGDTRDKLYGIAVDIGTTTIAAYLTNMVTGKTESTYSCLNPQKVFGDDVISRISYTVENKKGIEELSTAIIECLNNAVDELVKNTNIENKSIYHMVLTGNTTMLHMAMGLDCRSLAVSPFIPVTIDLQEFTAKELSLNLNPEAVVSVLPCVSAYAGADILCVIMSCGISEKDEISLVIDIGTNGEIALYKEGYFYLCSAPAGPAFEGANLTSGMGGVTGAVDSVVLTKDVDYTTIGNSTPVGICGSGVIDAIAQLLDKGIIDGTGRILDKAELPQGLGKGLTDRIQEVDGLNTFVLFRDSEKSIYVTQKDIREIQNAKAAISAGIRVLAKESNTDLSKIKKVYLAGGFGSLLNINSAKKVGLIPKEIKGEIIAVGNAAGAGAVKTMLSSKAYFKLNEIKENSKYVELSGNNDFIEFYIESMMLE